MYKYFEINTMQLLFALILLTSNVPLQIDKCTLGGACTPRHVARNFDRGANNNIVSTFVYSMSLALVFKASSIKGAFFWRFFLNNYVQI